MDQQDIAQRLVEIGIALSEERQLPKLLAKVVDHSLNFTNADAASLYVRDRDELEFRFTRNLTLENRSTDSQFTTFRLPIDSRSVAGYVALNKHTVLIPDVYNRHDNLPFNFDDSFDKRVGYHSQSMLVVPIIDNLGQVLGVLQLINHMHNGEAEAFPEELRRPVEALAGQVAIALRNVALVDQLALSQRETVYRLCRAAETRDNETGNHIKRISYFAHKLAELRGEDASFRELVFDASPMHDLGKIGIPDAVLLKPGRLTDNERVIMNTHAQLGYEMLAGSDSALLEMGATIAQTHHERWDGTGYPQQLQGKHIPLEGRITALVDVFDALSSPRVYKPAWPLDKVIDYCLEQRDQHFDGELVDTLIENMDDFLAIREEYADEFDDDESEHSIITAAIKRPLN
jgi:HD-GYP domain-containing protein (c-di-GMP phosphodiesterase class II)